MDGRAVCGSTASAAIKMLLCAVFLFVVAEHVPKSGRLCPRRIYGGGWAGGWVGAFDD